MTVTEAIEQAIERGDVVEFRSLIRDLRSGELTVLTGQVAKQPALRDALWKEIRSRK